MKNIRCAALCVSGLVFLASAARADENIDDVHCFIVNLEMANSETPIVKSAGLMGQLYWMGRLDGRAPGLDMESLVIAELPKMTGALYQAEAKRCGDALMKRGSAETEMGKDMQRRGAEMKRQEDSR